MPRIDPARFLTVGLLAAGLLTTAVGCGGDTETGTAGSDTSEDALKTKPGVSGEATLKGLGCQERSGSRDALEIKWFPPASLEFVANNGKQFNESIPMVSKVSSTGVTGAAKYSRGGPPHTATLDIPRSDGQGTFVLDGTKFELKCYYVETSTWERHL